jgi:signal transduction histidine kinase
MRTNPCCWCWARRRQLPSRIPASFQQSDLISEFVHELRTPLSSLSTATYLLLRPEMSQEQRDQIINNIHSETMRLNALASSFLDLARLESGVCNSAKLHSALPI